MSDNQARLFQFSVKIKVINLLVATITTVLLGSTIYDLEYYNKHNRVESLSADIQSESYRTRRAEYVRQQIYGRFPALMILQAVFLSLLSVSFILFTIFLFSRKDALLLDDSKIVRHSFFGVKSTFDLGTLHSYTINTIPLATRIRTNIMVLTIYSGKLPKQEKFVLLVGAYSGLTKKILHEYLDLKRSLRSE